MKSPPKFVDNSAYRAKQGDLEFWKSALKKIVKRHDLVQELPTISAGVGGTHPTFISDNCAIKLFGHIPRHKEKFFAECAAHLRLATDPKICAPRMLAKGHLFEDGSWPYIVTARIKGQDWLDADLTMPQRHTIAQQLGQQIQRIHALPVSDIAPVENWLQPNIVDAAEKSSLPPQLLPQINDFMSKLVLPDRVFVHGDLFSRHVFIHENKLSGIIDWGDAMVADRHLELAKLHLDVFNCDKALLATFLNAANWPMRPDFAKQANFARQAMGQALIRQAVGGPHDTFYQLPDLFPVENIKTLDELADLLFGI